MGGMDRGADADLAGQPWARRPVYEAIVTRIHPGCLAPWGGPG